MISSQMQQGRDPPPRHLGISVPGDSLLSARQGCERPAELALLTGLDALQRLAPTENTS